VARISGRAVELTISVPESLQENFVKNSCSFFLLAILVGRVGERAGEKSMSILKNKNVHVKWRVIPFFCIEVMPSSRWHRVRDNVILWHPVKALGVPTMSDSQKRTEMPLQK
jgi:hypothetical protein